MTRSQTASPGPISCANTHGKTVKRAAESERIGIVRFLGSSHVSHVPFLALYHTRAFPARGRKTVASEKGEREKKKGGEKKERDEKRHEASFFTTVIFVTSR